jgi:catalase
MLGHLNLVDADLGAAVADGLGMAGQADVITPAVEPRDLPPSPALSILAKAPATIEGRKVGVLIGEGFDAALLARLRKAIEAEGAMCELVAPKIGETTAADGSVVAADHIVSGGPSWIFDAVVVMPGAEAMPLLTRHPAAVGWVADAFAHCKVMGVVGSAQPLLDKGNVEPDRGVIDLGAGKAVAVFIDAAKAGRIWEREADGQDADKPRAPDDSKPAAGKKGKQAKVPPAPPARQAPEPAKGVAAKSARENPSAKKAPPTPARSRGR